MALLILWERLKKNDADGLGTQRGQSQILTTLNGKFLQGAPPMEVYRASIENEGFWPAFATEKGSS